MAELVAPGAVVGRIGARPVREADLVALVDESGAGQRQQQQRRGPNVLRPEPRGQPVEVVVREHPGDALELGCRPDRRP